MSKIMWYWVPVQYDAALEVYIRLVSRLLRCALLGDSSGPHPQADMIAKRMSWPTLLAGSVIATVSSAAPSGFPATGNGLWYKTPGTIWSKEWLPVGNGYLAGKCRFASATSKQLR